MKRKTFSECIALILLSVTTGAVLYRQLADSNPVTVYAASPGPSPRVEIPITDRERSVIRDYVGARSGSKPGRILPPGLARKAVKNGELQTDWKKVVKGEIIPTALYRECQPLPKDLASRLPPAP